MMTPPTDLFPKLWGLWLMAGLLIEGAALFRPQYGDTLSELIWRFLDGGPARWVLFIGFLIWASVHFLGHGRLG